MAHSGKPRHYFNPLRAGGPKGAFPVAKWRRWKCQAHGCKLACAETCPHCKMVLDYPLVVGSDCFEAHKYQCPHPSHRCPACGNEISMHSPVVNGGYFSADPQLRTQPFCPQHLEERRAGIHVETKKPS